MELWYPPTDRPHLLDWWRPLIQASALARQARSPWSIHVDELVLVGRVDRPPRPSVWVYRHPVSRGELYVDATGQPYRFTKTPKGRSLGRFSQCGIEVALWRAGLPTVVDPIWYDEPPQPREAPDDERAQLPPDGRPTRREPRRRGHLTVHDGGRSLAG